MSKISITRKNIPVYLFILFAVLANIFIFNNYRVDDIDDPWSLSFAYNYTHHGYEFDKMYRTEKIGGVAYFGKIYAYLYSAILDRVGWTKLNGHLISISLVLISLYLWYKIFGKLGIERRKILYIVLLMLVFEPYISMGSKTRSDALAYLFSTLCFFFFLRKNYALSGIAGLMGLETHPLGVSGFFYALAYFLWQHKFFLSDKKVLVKSLLLFILGIALGSAVYLGLHHRYILGINHELDVKTGTGAASNYLFAFFFESKMNRHLAEFVLFAAALMFFFVKKMHRTHKLTLIIVVMQVLQSFLLPRGNANYAVFAYPAFILLLVQVAFQLKKENWMLLLLFLLLFPQYAYLYKMNLSGRNQTKYIKEISTMLPDKSLPVFGSANEWFAFYDRDYYYFYLIGKKSDIKECYLIEENDFRKEHEVIPARYKKRELLKEFTFNGEKIQVYHLSVN